MLQAGMAEQSLLKQEAIPPVPWFITAVNLHTRSSCRLEIILGDSLAESKIQLKEKLFG